MIEFDCHACRTRLSAVESQIGKLVRCPTCLATLKVPGGAEAEPVAATAPAAARQAPAPRPSPMPSAARPGGATGERLSAFRPGGGAGGRRYGFNCGYCSSRLEATESMAAQDGQCPTCGNNITIPILDRYGRLIDPKTREIIKQDPHPVHAYAAAGERAPKIFRTKEGKQSIACPRCSSVSPISANNCKTCGMPFTMEGTTLEAGGSSNTWCVTALVLGILGIPAFCSIIVPPLAVAFGITGYIQVTRPGAEGSGKGMAIAGIVCGLIGTILTMLYYARLM